MTWLDCLTFDTVLVNLTDGGPTLKGLRAGVYDDGLVLRQVSVLEDDGTTRMLNGDIFVPREKVLMLQLLPPEVIRGDAK